MAIKLMCLPHAGAGAGIYRPWRGHRSDVIEVTPVQLPGREERFDEDCHPTMTLAAQGTAVSVLQQADGAPFALFGHSFGALLAYETANVLAARGVPPSHLVVSGAWSPTRWFGRVPVSTLSDDELAGGLRRMVGYDHEALHDPDLRKLLLPVLRADMALLEEYRPAAAAVPAPITALRGRDDTLVSAADCAEWAGHTTAAFQLAEVPGGHMYFTDAWPLLWETIETALHAHA